MNEERREIIREGHIRIRQMRDVGLKVDSLEALYALVLEQEEELGALTYQVDTAFLNAGVIERQRPG